MPIYQTGVTPAAAGTAIITSADYATLVTDMAASSDGDLGHTSDDYRWWRYNTVCGRPIPAHIHDGDTVAVLNNGDDGDYWDGDATADADGDQSYDNATDLSANGWDSPASAGDGAIADSGGSPTCSASAGGSNWMSFRFSGWSQPASDRYMAIVDFDVNTAADDANFQIRVEDGAKEVDVTGYVSALNEVGFSVGTSADGEGRALHTPGVPFFIIWDLSSDNALSRIIVPGVLTEPTIERVNAETTGSGPRITVGCSGTAAPSSAASIAVDRCQLYTL
jgi:hypothetical protein